MRLLRVAPLSVLSIGAIRPAFQRLRLNHRDSDAPAVDRAPSEVVIVGKRNPDLDGKHHERRSEQDEGDHEKDRGSPDMLDAEKCACEGENDENRRGDAAADG